MNWQARWFRSLTFAFPLFYAAGVCGALTLQEISPWLSECQLLDGVEVRALISVAVDGPPLGLEGRDPPPGV